MLNKKGRDLLGYIAWHGAWRQYCFYPSKGTVFSTGCMDDIQSFIKQAMEARK